MKTYLQVYLAVSILGISTFPSTAMEKFSTTKFNPDSSLKEIIDSSSLSRSRQFLVDSVALANAEFDDNYSINLSSIAKETSLENGVRNDHTSIWKESVGEPENNSLKITLLRF